MVNGFNVVKEVELEIKKVPVPRLTAYISFYPERATGGWAGPLFHWKTEELNVPRLSRSLMAMLIQDINEYQWIYTYLGR